MRKQRIEQRSNGKYYPQYRWMFMWLEYAEGSYPVCFNTEELATRYLDIKHAERAHPIAWIEWTPK